MNLYLSDVEKFGQLPQTYLSRTSGVPLIEEASGLSCDQITITIDVSLQEIVE